MHKSRHFLSALPIFALLLMGQQDCETEETDIDGDGYSEDAGDCNDNDPSINPGATEICDDNLDNDCSGFDSLSLASVQEQIFDPSCINCHADVPSMNLDLREGYSYEDIVNVPSEQVPEMQRVLPGYPEDSYLMHKLWGSHVGVGGEGDIMPKGGAMDQHYIDMVEVWILDGAREVCD